MLTALIILIIIACLLLWLVILIQNPKGGGLSSQFGGSSVTNIIGAKQSVDVIEKATWILGGAVLVLVVLSSYVTAPKQDPYGPGITPDGGAPTNTIDEGTLNNTGDANSPEGEFFEQPTDSN
ncbi:preprotein translocase subunit SecG [bacterium]|nr:preprotein translocase subunit SecG [bacterium]